MKTRTKRNSSPPLWNVHPTPEQIARYLGHHVVVEVRLAPDIPEYCAAGRIVVASATGVILRDTTDYTESFLTYTEIASIRPAVPA